MFTRTYELSCIYMHCWCIYKMYFMLAVILIPGWMCWTYSAREACTESLTVTILAWKLDTVMKRHCKITYIQLITLLCAWRFTVTGTSLLLIEFYFLIVFFSLWNEPMRSWVMYRVNVLLVVLNIVDFQGTESCP